MTDGSPVCLITGGASGIGAACVAAFAAAGYRVAFGDLQVGKGEALAKKFDAVFIRLDVSSEAEFANAFKAVLKRWGCVDCLVNNAAIAGALGPIAEIPLEELQPRRSGAIVNIASVAGLAGGHGPHVYSACKAAVVALTRSVALELAESGIRVNAICPGAIETPIHTGVTDERWVERMAKIRAGLKDYQAIDRMGLPAEIAAAVLWLASDAASYVTGQAIAVDGGLTAGRPWRQQPEFLRQYHKARKL